MCFRDEGYEALAHESLCKPSCAYATPLGISMPALQTICCDPTKKWFLDFIHGLDDEVSV